MRRFCGLLGLLALCAIPVRAQITPRYEIGAGFDFTYAGPQALSSTTATPHLNMYGWNANGVYNLRRIVGVAFDVSGVYNTQVSPNQNIGNATTQNYPCLLYTSYVSTRVWARANSNRDARTQVEID